MPLYSTVPGQDERFMAGVEPGESTITSISAVASVLSDRQAFLDVPPMPVFGWMISGDF